MKRKLLSVLLVLAMALTLLPTAAFAEDATTLPQKDSDTNTITLTGNVSLADTYTVSEELTIDLKGFSITGPDGKDAIKVATGGNLTIKDSTVSAIPDESATGGRVIGKGSGACALLNEAGTVTVEGGIFTTEGGNASAYAIWNGSKTSFDSEANESETTKMTFPASTTALVTRTDNYTAICNKNSAIMEIAGGKFVGGSNIALKNDYFGRLTISGGEFTNSAGNNAVVTFWETTISDGTFNNFVVSAMDGSETGKLEISGGTFKAGLSVGVFKDQSHVAQGKQAAITVQDGATVNGVIKKADGSDWYAEATKDSVGITIAGGTFSLDEEPQGDWLTLPAGKVFKQENSKWVLGDPEKAALEFTNSTATIFGKEATAMGSFDLGTPTTEGNVTTYHVTGSANYLTEYDQWNVTGETEGHYLPLNISTTSDTLAQITTYNRTVGAKEGKEIALTNGAEDVAFFLDGKVTCDVLEGNTFKVVAGGKDDTGANVYVIDFSELVLLPKPVVDEAAGTTTEVELKPAEGGKPAQVVTETKKDDAVIGSVALPANTEGLGGMSVEVKPVETSALPQAVQDSDTKVATALKDTDTKLVQVTVKVTDEQGNETEYFTNENGALQNAAIVITIGGLESGATYYVFSVNETTGAVTSYGYKTLEANEDSIQINSKHLTILAAAKVADAPEDGLTAEDVLADDSVSKDDEEDSGLTKSNGSTPTPGTATYTVAAAAGTIGDKVTIHGETGKFYIVQIWNGRNTPAAIFCLSSGAAAEVEFYANSGATINIWQADSETAFDGKVPQGLTEVEPQA